MNPERHIQLLLESELFDRSGGDSWCGTDWCSGVPIGTAAALIGAGVLIETDAALIGAGVLIGTAAMTWLHEWSSNCTRVNGTGSSTP